MNKAENKKAYFKGLKSGVPIGLGYLIVAFSLGISAKLSGVTPIQGFIASLLTIASAGEYAGFTVIGENLSLVSGIFEMAFVILVANCRYFLMSCALSQRIAPGTHPLHRIGMGAFITDEIFGVTIAQEGDANPFFTYGAATSSVLPWAIGTSMGIIVGDILSDYFVKALAVSLYGMFIAIIIPPAKKHPVIRFLIPICFAASLLWDFVPYINRLNQGLKIIILTVLISALISYLFPFKDEPGGDNSNA